MKKSIAFCLALIAAIGVSPAQTPVNFSVREEVVKPSMTTKFQEGMKKFKAACEEAKLNFSWNTLAFDDNTYLFVAPLANIADLDKNPFAGLEAKFGKEGTAKLWSLFDGCVESYSDYVITRMPELSYLSPAAGENARDILFWYVETGKEMQAQAILAEWKKLYEANKIQNGFLIYQIRMGKEFGYAIVGYGKSYSDIALKDEKTWETIGKEATALWEKTMSITRKFYTKRGRIMPEYSYAGSK